MPLYTTYLAFLRKADYNPLRVFPDALQETIFYYVMRNRGNDAVAPSGLLLEWLSMQKEKYGDAWETVGKLECWSKYEEEYLDQLKRFDEAKEWMRRVSQEAKRANVVLICYEKDVNHCHRKLLAEEIVRRFNVEYKGELTEKDLKI